MAGAGGRRGRVCHRLPHERLARIEGGHEGATFGQEAKSCEGYTELHDLASLAYLSVSGQLTAMMRGKGDVGLGSSLTCSSYERVCFLCGGIIGSGEEAFRGPEFP